MNLIQCPAGKGLLTKEACLECSRAIPSPCGYSYALLKAIYNNDGDRSGEIHVTDITGCLLKAYYGKTDPIPTSVADRLVLFLGNAVHNAAEDSDQFVDCELPIDGDGIMGRIDQLYKDGVLTDFKTTRWMVLSKLPYGSHSLLVNIYAHLLRQKSIDVKRMFIQYVDMSGPTKCRKCKVPVQLIDNVLVCPRCLTAIKDAHLGAALVEIPFMNEEDIAEQIKTRVNILSQAMRTQVAPPAEPSFLCSYCGESSSFRCPEGASYA